MMSCKRSIKANHALDDYSARRPLYSLHSVKIPTIALTDVQYLSTLPSLIWKKCSVVSKKIIQVYVT